MGRFSLRRNREDHATDEELEYYQPETGQTLQRSSLHNLGESESEAEGLHGGSGGGSISVAAKLRRTSVDLGRRLAGKLRTNRQSLSRASSGLTFETDVRALETSRHSRQGSGASEQDPSDRSHHAVATTVVTPPPLPAAATASAGGGPRGPGTGRRVSLGGFFAAAGMVTGGSGSGGGAGGGALTATIAAAAGTTAAGAGASGECGAPDVPGGGGRVLRSIASLFSRTSISGDTGHQHGTVTATAAGTTAGPGTSQESTRFGSPPGGGGGGGGGSGDFRNSRRHNTSNRYGSTSGSVLPSPGRSATGMSNPGNDSSDVVVIQPATLLVPVEERHRLKMDTTTASTAVSSAAIPSDGIIMSNGTVSSGGGVGNGGGAWLLSSGQLRNASLRHYLQDGSVSIATAASAAMTPVAAAAALSVPSTRGPVRGGGGGGGGDDDLLSTGLAMMYASTSLHRPIAQGLHCVGNSVGAGPSNPFLEGVDPQLQQTAANTLSNRQLPNQQTQQQQKCVPSTNAFKPPPPILPPPSLPPSPRPDVPSNLGSRVSHEPHRHPLSVSSVPAGSDTNRLTYGISVASRSVVDNTSGDERTSTGKLLAQLQQQIADLRRLKEASNTSRSGVDVGGGGTASAVIAPIGSDDQKQQQSAAAIAAALSSARLQLSSIASGTSGGGSSGSLMASSSLHHPGFHRPPSQSELQLLQLLSPSLAGDYQQQQQQQQQVQQHLQQLQQLQKRLSNSQSGNQTNANPQQQQQPPPAAVVATAAGSQRAPNQVPVRSPYRSTMADGSSAEVPTIVTNSMLAIYEDVPDVPAPTIAAASCGAAASSASGGGFTNGGGVGAHPISLSPETSTRTSPNGPNSVGLPARVARGTSRLKLPIMATFAFRSTTGSGTGSGDSTDASVEDLHHRSRGASTSFSLGRVSPRVGFGQMLAPFESLVAGLASRSPHPGRSGSGGGGVGGGSGSSLVARVKNSKTTALSGKAPTATVTGLAAPPPSPTGSTAAFLLGSSGSTNNPNTARNDKDASLSQRLGDGSPPASGAVLQRSATLNKLRRAVDTVRIAMIFKAISVAGRSRRAALQEGASASSPQLRQPSELAGRESLRAELSNMDLSPKLRRGRLRRVSVDGFVRDILNRNFPQQHQQHQRQSHPRRRSLDRDSVTKVPMANRYFDNDSDDEDDAIGQSPATAEPPYEIGLPVPPAPRASFDYTNEEEHEGTELPWSAQSSHAPSFDESVTSINPSNQSTSEPPTTNRHEANDRPHDMPSDSVDSGASGPGSTGISQGNDRNSGNDGTITTATTAATVSYGAGLQPTAPPLPPPLPPLQSPPSTLPILPPIPSLPQTPFLKPSPGPHLHNPHHQPSRFAPKVAGDSSRSLSPVNSTMTQLPSSSLWSAAPSVTAAPLPAAAATTVPRPSSSHAALTATTGTSFLTGMTIIANGSDSDDEREGESEVEREREDGAKKARGDRTGGNNVGGGSSSSSSHPRPQGIAATSPPRSSADLRTVSAQRRLKQGSQRRMASSGEVQMSSVVEVATIGPNPIASDLQLDDLIQAISRSGSGLTNGLMAEGARSEARGTGTGSPRSKSPSDAMEQHAVGRGAGGGGTDRLIVHSSSRSGDPPGSTLQVILRRSHEQLSPGASRAALAVLELQAAEDVCPLEPSFVLKQLPQTRQQPPVSASAVVPLPLEIGAAAHGLKTSTITHNAYSDSIKEGPARETPQVSTVGGGSGSAAGCGQDSLRIGGDSARGGADGAIRGCGGGGAGSIGNGGGSCLAAHPLLQRLQTFWDVAEFTRSSSSDISLPDESVPSQDKSPNGGARQVPTVPSSTMMTIMQGLYHEQHQHQRQQKQAMKATTMASVGGGGISKTVQVLLQKLNALPPSLRAEIVKQLHVPMEVQTLLHSPVSATATAPSATATAATAAAVARPVSASDTPVAASPFAGSGGVDAAAAAVHAAAMQQQQQQQQQQGSRDDMAAVVTEPISVPGGETICMVPLLAINSRHRNPLPPELMPEITATAAAQYGTSPPHVPSTGAGRAPTNPLANGTTPAVATATATEAATTCTTMSAVRSPQSPGDPYRQLTSSNSSSLEADAVIRARATRRSLQPSEAFLSGKVDCNTLSVPMESNQSPRRVIAALRASGLEIDVTPPPASLPLQQSTSATVVGGDDGAGARAAAAVTAVPSVAILYRPSGKNTYQPTSAEVMLAKSAGTQGSVPALASASRAATAPGIHSSSGNDNWLLSTRDLGGPLGCGGLTAAVAGTENQSKGWSVSPRPPYFEPYSTGDIATGSGSGAVPTCTSGPLAPQVAHVTSLLDPSADSGGITSTLKAVMSCMGPVRELHGNVGCSSSKGSSAAGAAAAATAAAAASGGMDALLERLAEEAFRSSAGPDPVTSMEQVQSGVENSVALSAVSRLNGGPAHVHALAPVITPSKATPSTAAVGAGPRAVQGRAGVIEPGDGGAEIGGGLQLHQPLAPLAFVSEEVRQQLQQLQQQLQLVQEQMAVALSGWCGLPATEAALLHTKLPQPSLPPPEQPEFEIQQQTLDLVSGNDGGSVSVVSSVQLPASKLPVAASAAEVAVAVSDARRPTHWHLVSRSSSPVRFLTSLLRSIRSPSKAQSLPSQRQQRVAAVTAGISTTAVVTAAATRGTLNATASSVQDTTALAPAHSSTMDALSLSYSRVGLPDTGTVGGMDSLAPAAVGPKAVNASDSVVQQDVQFNNVAAAEDIAMQLKQLQGQLVDQHVQSQQETQQDQKQVVSEQQQQQHQVLPVQQQQQQLLQLVTGLVDGMEVGRKMTLRVDRRPLRSVASATGEAEVLDVPTPDLTSWEPLPPQPPLPSHRGLPAAAWSKFSATATVAAATALPTSLPPAVRNAVPPGYTVVSNQLFRETEFTSGGGATGNSASTPMASAPAMVLLPTECLRAEALDGSSTMLPDGIVGGIDGRGGGGSSMAPDGVHLVLPAMVVVDSRALSPDRLSLTSIAQQQHRRASGRIPGGDGLLADGLPGVVTAASGAHQDRRGSGGGVSRALLASHPLTLQDGTDPPESN